VKLVVFSRNYPEYCFRYANAMARHGDVLLIMDRDWTTTLFDIAGAPKHDRLTVYLEDLGSLWSVPVSLAKVLRRIFLFRPDYVHLQEVPDLVAPVLALTLRPFFRIIWTVHDPLPHSGRDAQLRGRLALQHLGRRLADLVVVHGPSCHDHFIREYPGFAGRVLLSHHGVMMTPPATKDAGHPNTVLFFGRMEKYKGLDTLIEAAEILDRRGVDYRMVVAGQGPELDRNLERLQGLPRFRVVRGIVPPKQTSELFHGADIVVLPYKDASQSGVAAAAFGSHCPVIASRVGGLPDVVEHGLNGLLVEPDNAVALADALQEILQHRDVLERLTDGARATAQGKLSWSTIASELMDQIDAHAIRASSAPRSRSLAAARRRRP
jgi:glycosyltransferase involved in cell wall biosynthesis